MVKNKISDFAKLNRLSLQKTSSFNNYLYLDTGNITENVINEIKKYDKSEDLPSRAKRIVTDDTIIYSTVRPRQKHFGILKHPQKNMVVSTGFATIDVLNKKEVDPYYLYYFLTQKSITDYLSAIAATSVSSYPSIVPDDIGNLELIIDCDVESQKNKIAILKIIDEKIAIINRTITELENLSESIYDYIISSTNKSLKVKDIVNVITGKEDANFSSKNGIYPFFTCADSILYCDIPAYDGKAILISGNGEFYVKYYDGKFNAYQRTYVLMPNKEKYVGLIYEASKKLIESFKYGSNGSIIKFITKDDIDNIDVLIPEDDKLIDLLNNYLSLINIKRNEIIKLQYFKDFLLPLLINGQIKIDA